MGTLKVICLTAGATVIVGVLVLVAFTPNPALASGVVGTGDPSSCTEGALDSALAGGGAVTFNCGASPFTLTVTTTKSIAADTSVDGGGLITLSGGGSARVFLVNSGANLTLENLTVAGGLDPGDGGGGAIANNGTLNVTNCTISNNTGRNSSGPGAIANNGTLSVTNTTFSGNTSGAGAGEGGAICNYSATPVNITDSAFSGNSAGNVGGAIANPVGTVNITNSTFAGNSAGGVGGAIANPFGTVNITNSTFSGNSAGSGGAIYTDGFDNNFGSLTVSNSTFAGNSGGSTVLHCGGTVNVVNSTFAGNGVGGAAISMGGGSVCTFDGGTLDVTNSTFSGNLGGALSLENGATVLKNTVLADNGAANCTGDLITDGGHNLRWPSTDTSCVGDFGDPMLAPLADNGGPTQTMALQTGSAAINAGDNNICAAPPVNSLDQRGYPRPGTGATSCSIGAYEFDSVTPPSPTATPTVTSTPTITTTPTPTRTGTSTPTPNLGKVKCENAVATNLLQLAVCIKKCHNKWASKARVHKPFDEEACERGTGKPVSCRAAYDKRSGKLVAGGKCPTCLNTKTQASLADSMFNFFEGQISQQIYCAGAPPNP